MDAKYTITSINSDLTTGAVKLISFMITFTDPQLPGAATYHGGVIAPTAVVVETDDAEALVAAVKATLAPQFPQIEAFAAHNLEMDYLTKTTKVISKVPEVLTSLTSRRFWLAALEIGITKESLSVTIDGMNLPTLDAQRMKTELMEATEFERDNPVLIALVSYLNIPQAQFDTLWRWAMDL